MPRQARLDSPGTLHHVMIRGIERRRIVDDEQDRRDFVRRLGSLASETLATRSLDGVSRDICYLIAADANCFGIMARRARVEYSGALYHVITRGNQRQKIFYDDRDRTKYFEQLTRLGRCIRFSSTLTF